MKNASGALVDEAQPDTPAAKAGVQAGDVITAVNGNPVKDSRTLAREISVMAPGSTAKLDILRKGEAMSIEVTLAKMPNQPEKQAKAGDMDNGSAPHLGISVAPASDVAGAGSKGVVITAVDPEGPAAEHGLKSGDVILDVGGKSVSSAGIARRPVGRQVRRQARRADPGEERRQHPLRGDADRLTVCTEAAPHPNPLPAIRLR